MGSAAHPTVLDHPDDPRWAPLRRIWIEDVELLYDSGSTSADVAARLGVRLDSLYRVLERKGRLDLWERHPKGREHVIRCWCGLAVDPDYVERTGTRHHRTCGEGPVATG